MRIVADMQVEFLGRTLWWIGVGVVVGVTLLVHALMQRRAAARERADVARQEGNLARRGVVRGEVGGRKISAAAVAAVVGVLVLGVTGVLAWAERGEFSGRVNGGAQSGWASGALAAWVMFILIGAVVIFYRGVYAYLTGGRRMALMGLRIAGLTSLVLLMFRPVLAIVGGDEDTKPRVAVIVDASASMGYNDAPNQPNRFRQAAIAIENTLVPRISGAYKVEVFAYDGKHTGPLGSAEELDNIAPDGNVTDLGAAISMGLSSQGGGHGGAAEAILFSDGIHNGAAAIESELPKILAAATRAPVDTVRVGSSDLEPSTVPDIAVVSVDGPQTAVVNNQLVLTASIKSTAMSDRTVRVSLMEKGDGTAGTAGAGTWNQLDEQRLVLHSSAMAQSVQLKFTPEKVGRLTVRVQVPVDPDERSDANNQQDFTLLVTDPKLTVLYVEGRVRPEVGPLRRALEQDPNLSAMSLVQTTAGRFEQSGAKIGSGPTEVKGLPTTLAQWKMFKVIVLGDLDASFLNAAQQKNVEQTVSEGAGLLMIGGQNSFAPGGWGRTALAGVLPVDLDAVVPPQIDAAFVPKLTAVGAAHPIFRNIGTFFIGPAGGKGAVTVPDLSGCVALKSAKAGASVLAVHPTAKVDGEPAIVLAVEQYGKGRTAAFAADTTWRWSLAMRAMQQDSPYNRFWGQMIRWLASEENLEKKTGASVTAMMSKERFEAGESVVLKAAVTDTQGQATNYASGWATVTGPDGVASKVDLARPEEGVGIAGIYNGVTKPALAGTYKVAFGATKDGVDLGKDESSFEVMPAAGERDVLAANPRTLETISKSTYGTSVDLAGLSSLADRLMSQARPSTVTASMVPLYHPRGFFLFFVAVLGMEWFLRRRWQLQ